MALDLALISLPLVFQIFILLNPFSSFPVLISAYQRKMDSLMIAVHAVLLAFVVAVIMVFIGPKLFNVFGITLDSFRIAGGVVLFLLGLSTVTPHPHEEKAVGKVDSIISIIATPLLTGPATISFLTLKVYEVGVMPLLMNVTIAFVLVGIVFILFSLTIKQINFKIIGIISRVVGLFLTAVAIEMIASGISGLIVAAAQATA
ncbi:MarC family protein [Candidatus Woesearchaeota archaeon]|nr:MarC family protein [Candidatus Woesearchaeota archaeon]